MALPSAAAEEEMVVVDGKPPSLSLPVHIVCGPEYDPKIGATLAKFWPLELIFSFLLPR